MPKVNTRELSRADKLAALSSKLGVFLHQETWRSSEADIRSEIYAAIQTIDHAAQLISERDAEKAESNNAPKAATPTK